MAQSLLPAWRELPIYRDGLDIGVLIGVRLALDAVDAERVRQQQLTAADPDSKSPTAACRAYADGRLLAVAKVIAARFRG
jgi:hypothetical protein